MTRKKIKRALFLSVILVLLFVFSGCPSAGSGDSSSDPATVTVDISAALSALGISSAKVSSVQLTVTADDMTTITKTYTTTDTASLDVPSGTGRTFTARVNMVSSQLIKYYSGSVISDLTAGAAKSVTPVLAVGETKILIPDCANNRVIVMDDISGSGWTVALDVSTLGSAYTGSTFEPLDVEIDANGDFYVCGSLYDGESSYDGILIRMKGLGDSAPEIIIAGYEVETLAIDPIGRYLYYVVYSEGAEILRIDLATLADLTAAASVAINIPAGAGLSSLDTYGMTVDSQGFLYFVNDYYGDPESVVKIKPDPAASVFAAKYDLSSASGSDENPDNFYAWDVIVKGDFVYVSCLAQDDESAAYSQGKLLCLKKSDLTFSRNIGWPSGDRPAGSGAEEFYGPVRFLAVTNDKITVTDEGTDAESSRICRVVSLSSDASGWTTYGEYGTDSGQFDFFSGYLSFGTIGEVIEGPEESMIPIHASRISRQTAPLALPGVVPQAS